MHPFTLLSRLVYWVIGWKARPSFPKDIKKSVIVVAPHTSNWDFFVLVMARSLLSISHAKFLAKKELFDHPFGFFFRWIGGTPVDRSQRTSLVDQAIEKFNTHERFVLALTPEGTRKSAPWKSGFYHIARGANVPIALGFADFEQRQVGIGQLVYPTGNYEEDLAKIQAFYQNKVPFHPANSFMNFPTASKRKRWLNRIYALIRLCFVVIVFYLLWHLPALIYGIQQAYGQISILINAKPVASFLADPTYPDSLKAKIRFIEEVKAFTVNELGLDPSNSYTTLFDQQGQPILWVLTASKPFALEAKTWEYPIFGSFSYKGFFDKQRALRERERFETEGWDTRLGVVNAWSTLGILNDPILSNFLDRDEGNLANLIIHELTHGTIFLKDKIAYNENLADFVGDEGAQLFLKQKYGSDSPVYHAYINRKADRKLLSNYVLQAAKQLDSLYQTFDDTTPIALKLQKKATLISQIRQIPDTLQFASSFYRHYFDEYEPNNAFFMAYRRYREKQNEFKLQCDRDFGGDLPAFIAYMKQESPSLF